MLVRYGERVCAACRNSASLRYGLRCLVSITVPLRRSDRVIWRCASWSGMRVCAACRNSASLRYGLRCCVTACVTIVGACAMNHTRPFVFRSHKESLVVDMLRNTLLTLLFLACANQVAMAQSPQERQRGGGRSARLVTRDRVVPYWSVDGQRFWYRVDLGQGRKEFVLVDAQAGARQLAFDHAEVAKAIGGDATAEHLPIERLEFSSQKEVLLLRGSEKTGLGTGRRRSWNRATTSLRKPDLKRRKQATRVPHEPGRNRDHLRKSVE